MRIEALNRRAYWIAELAKLSGSFGDDSTRMIEELRAEVKKDGVEILLISYEIAERCLSNTVTIPLEEKLYSKYTDAVVSESLTAIGLRSALINTRGDAADVQARGRHYSLVADAKAFRLSRTAKNQKDFKVQAMDGWRNGLDYALLVCPIYQLPTRTSQIYQQAIARNVCILSYSHLAALVALASRKGQKAAENGLGKVLKTVPLLNPSKSAVDYWTEINRSLVQSLGQDHGLWTIEKIASIKALDVVKDESLKYLRAERNRLLGLSHQEALDELVRLAGLDSRITTVKRVEHGGLLEVDL